MRKNPCSPRYWLLIFSLLLSVPAVQADPRSSLKLYLSADLSVATTSSLAIEQGIRTALAEVDYRLGSYDLELVLLDHHGSTPRARKHLHRYLDDAEALAIFGGLHSPPLLATRDFINENRILVLSPWAAAGPITRAATPDNWIFRLSIDDTKAGFVIACHAVRNRGISRPALLLEQTGWGKSNQRTMNAALKAEGHTAAVTKWFNWGLSEPSARILLRDIHRSGADAIFLVANAAEAKVIAKAMISLPPAQRLPIFSHWGLTGGDFPEVIDNQQRQALKLEFIQTRFSFLSPMTSFQQGVLAKARQLYPDTIRQAGDIKAPTGFIHAYDLTRTLIAAIRQAGLTGDIKVDRAAVRHALEYLQHPVEGLLKTYRQPFSPYDPETTPDAHEALGMGDFTMATYGPNNEILLFPPLKETGQ